MSGARQFVAVKFRVGDLRTFTYSWDGEPFAEGDQVRVPDRSGDGWKKVFVVSTTDEEPPFPTKPILGLHTENEEADAPLLDRHVEHHPNSAQAMMAERRQHGA